MMNNVQKRANLEASIVFDPKDAALFIHDQCDQYDYLIAVACGMLSGFVDAFLVGAPGESVLGKWTDMQANQFVKFFAKQNGWSPRAGNEDNVNSAISFLEKKFKVNYDQQHNVATGGNVSGMTTTNHHLKSLAHSPSIIGLFFSILNQFTSTSTFLSGGQLITIKTDTFELQGGNFVSKLFCGIVNWFGHIVSDMAGSSGSAGRGSGVPIPFYELFQMCNFGKFKIGKDRQDLATLATRVFEEGYDLRFGVAMAIPVVLNELLVRLIWALKRKFYHKRPLSECIPLTKYQNLRTMLLIATGTLCVIDMMDAGIRSGGNALTFALRFNLIAWYRLATLALKAVFIRLKISADVQQYLESYRVVNSQLKAYIAQLEQIDMERFKQEAERYEQMSALLASATDVATLHAILVTQTKLLGLEIPWGDDFDLWMEATDQPFILQ